MSRSRQFLALAGLTALEAIRQPICLLLTSSCIVAIALVPMLLMHQFGEEGRLVRDSGLALHFVFGLFVGGYAACSSLAREMRNGTASVVLAKPVGRGTFFLAKFAGVAAVILVFSLCATVSTLLSERVAEKFISSASFTGYLTDWRTGIMLALCPFSAFLIAGAVNYYGHRPFESMAFILVAAAVVLTLLVSAFFDRHGVLSPLDFAVEWRIIPASILVTMALIVLSGIALALSVRLKTAPTLTMAAGIFVLGLMSDYLFGLHAGASVLCAVFYRIIPNWQHFWISDALSEGGTIPALYLLNAALYGGLYLLSVLCLGVINFSYAEVD